MSFTDVELSSAAGRAADGAGPALGPDQIAALLESWRPDVLRRMRRGRLWHDAPADELEDQFQDAAIILCARGFESEDHLRHALWAALGFRARDFWKSSRRREVPVAEFFDEALAREAVDGVAETAAIAADSRQVDDCLAELEPQERAVYRLIHGEGLSRGRTARALGVRPNDVLRALYTAQRKIDRVVVLLVSGRLCARRSQAVAALARSEAGGSQLVQAQAHLAHCSECLLMFREYRAELSRRVASVLPFPALPAASHAVGGLDRILGALRHLGGGAKRMVYSVADRAPKSSAGAEAVVGGGTGGAVAAKLAVGLCVTAAAGGGALCVQTLGLFGNGTGSGHAGTAERHPRSAHAPGEARRVSTAPAATAALRPAKPRPSAVKRSGAGLHSSASKQPQQEFFDGAGGSGAGTTKSSPTPVHSASAGAPSSSRSGSSSPRNSGGGEFFGQ